MRTNLKDINNPQFKTAKDFTFETVTPAFYVLGYKQGIEQQVERTKTLVYATEVRGVFTKGEFKAKITKEEYEKLKVILVNHSEWNPYKAEDHPSRDGRGIYYTGVETGVEKTSDTLLNTAIKYRKAGKEIPSEVMKELRKMKASLVRQMKRYKELAEGKISEEKIKYNLYYINSGLYGIQLNLDYMKNFKK